MTDLKKLVEQANGKSANEFWLATGRRPTEVIVELAQRLEKLAVESAALKVAVDGFNQELYGKGFEVLGWHLNGATEPLDSWFEDNDWNPETPATDAVLAEVEARGVEKALSVISVCRENICPGGLSENRQYEESIVQPHLDGISDELENLLVELREVL